MGAVLDDARADRPADGLLAVARPDYTNTHRLSPSKQCG
jgi:hypothetical protein